MDSSTIDALEGVIGFRRPCRKATLTPAPAPCHRRGMAIDNPSALAPSERPTPESLVGRVIDGKYRLDQVLATRSASAVFAATQLDLSMPLAIKVLFGPFPPQHLRTELFFQEGRIGATVAHPGIVRVFDIGVTADGLRYVVMDLLEGETLAAQLKDKGRLPVTQAVAIAAEVASVLDAVHTRGFLHRDLQPSNVLLVRGAQCDAPGAVKILGFGLAKPMRVVADERTRDTLRGLAGNPREIQTMPAILYGSPAYLSPEQILDQTLAPTSDVYSLGVVLYEMLTGTPVFGNAASATEAMAHHMGTRPEPPSSRAPDAEIPPELDSIVLRALAKHPSARFETAAQLRSALLDLLEASRRGAGVGPEPDADEEPESRAATLKQKAAVRSLVVSAVVGLALLVLVLAVALRGGRGAAAPVASAPIASASPSSASPPPAASEVTTSAELPTAAEPAVAGRSRPGAALPRMPITRSSAPNAPLPSTTPPAATTTQGYRIDDLKTPFR